MTHESTPVSAPVPGRVLNPGDALRTLRRDQGLSLRQLGERAGVSAATLSQLETGKTTLTLARALSLATALEVEPHLLHPDVQDEGLPDSAAPLDWRVFPPLQLDAALRGALQCFTETGYHGSSVRDIARRAGMSVPGLYHHYESKQAMLAALFELGMTDLLARSQSALAEGRDTRERFTNLVEALALFHAHRPELSFLGTSEMRALPIRDRRRHAKIRTDQQHLVDDEVEVGVEEGVFTTDEPHAAARAVVTMCVAIASWYRPGGLFTPEQVATQYAGFSLGIVGARP